MSQINFKYLFNQKEALDLLRKSFNFKHDRESFSLMPKKGWLDMRVGSPNFFQPVWNKEGPHNRASFQTDLLSSTARGSAMGYQKIGQPLQQLTEEIKKLHDEYLNCETHKRHVVVGTGAAQVISAAMWAMKQKAGYGTVFIQQPYWPRFKALTALQRLGFIGKKEDIDDGSTLEIKVIPNNPDGKSNIKTQCKSGDVIHDCCYNWPTYTNPWFMDVNVAIFGLSKLSGHASTRIGWAIVQDKELADNMNYYIEISSSGASYDSQVSAIDIISQIRHNKNILEKAKSIIRQRWKRLKLLQKKKGLFVKMNQSGMFLFVKPKDANLFKKIKAMTVDGKACGADYDGYFRLSIAVSDEVFDKLMKRLENK